MTPREFLELLWRFKPDEHYILLWTWPDKRSRWFQDTGKAAEFAVTVATSLDVYVGVGLSKQDYGPSKRCKSDEVSGICGIGTDLDLKSEAHGNKPLPTTLADALSILPTALPPTIIIATGNGLHAWWLFKEPYIFDSDQDRADVARVLARWHTMLRLNSAARGWVYDRLSDLARILRIPGTRNLKNPAKPKDVMVHSRTDRFYNFADIEEFLDDATIPDPEEQQRAADEWKERFADKSLKINPSARIPQELLDAWMDPNQTDPATAATFRNTWDRRRDNLKDSSQSGYDLALADFGVDAGLLEQQIVDLIIHHRQIHKQKVRSRLEYFQRTIAKAQRRSDWRPDVSAVAGAAEPVTASTSLPPTTGPASSPVNPVAPDEQQASETTRQSAPDPAPPPLPDAEAEARKKALLCERISQALTIPVVRLVKITGKDPQYRMELADGQKIEFPTVRKLLTFDSVYDAIAAAVGKCIPKIKPKIWEQLKQMILDACFTEQGTEEMEWEGAARMYLLQYLSETSFIPSVEGQELKEQRKPMVLDGAITVCASELQTYVNKTTFQNLSVKGIAGALSALGATSIRVRGPKHKDQSRWVLPAEFDPQEYPQTKVAV